MAQDILKQLNWVDVVVIILLIRSSYVGVKSGLTSEVFKTLGIITAIVFSYHFYSIIADFLSTYTLIPANYSGAISFVTITFFCILIFALFRIIIFKVLKMQFVMKLEMIGGGILGLVRGILVCGLIFMALTLIPVKYLNESINQGSLSAPSILNITGKAYSKLVKFYPIRQGPQSKEKDKINKTTQPKSK